MMKILVGSKNPSKIDGVRVAFERFFENVEAVGVDVDSEVPAQPVNGDTMLGAKNRVKNLKKYVAETGDTADYFVAVESGLMDMYGDPAIINACYLESSEGVSSYGYSAGFPIPEGEFDTIKEKGLATVIDNTFNTVKAEGPVVKGGIYMLTNGAVGRVEFATNSTIMAITRILHKEWR